MPDLERHPEGDVEDEVSGYRVFKPFVPHVLDEELAAELGRDKVDISFEGDPATASEEQPVIMYIPHDIPVKQVTRILADHDVEVNGEADPMQNIKEKLGQDEPLTETEVNAALKFLLGV